MGQGLRDALVGRLADSERVVEVGVGRRPETAAALAAAGPDVTATDLVPRETPSEIRFRVDDVTDPDLDLYAGADAIYALNCPPELHRPILTVARRVDAEFCFTTLGGDPPAVPADPVTVPGDTLYLARDGLE